MNTTKSFGKTWWSTAWIQVIESIDQDFNRIPQGQKCFLEGNIKEINIDENTVNARVRGSGRIIYDVKLTFVPFTEQEIILLKNFISDSPALASELFLGTLPENTLQLFEDKQLNLLPRNWNEISTSCTCEDEGFFCKHIAAVYYSLSDEIDKNPLVLFNLKNVSTDELIETAGLTYDAFDIQQQKLEDKFIDYQQITFNPIKPNYNDIEFTFEEVNTDSIFSLLAEKPIFYGRGNFKTILKNIYYTIFENIESINVNEYTYASRNTNFYLFYDKDNTLKVFVTPSNYFMFFLKTKGSRIRFTSDDKEIPVINYEKNCIEYTTKEGIIVDPDIVYEYFEKLPYNIDNSHSTDSSQFFCLLSSLAFSLIKSGAFIPDVVVNNNDSFQIRYIPFINNKNIKKTLQLIETIMPENIFFIENSKKILTKKGAIDLLSIFMTKIIHKFAQIDSKTHLNKLTKAFISNKAFTDSVYGDNSVALSIINWLDILHLKQKSVYPLLKIVKCEEDQFRLHMEIVSRKDFTINSIPLKEVFQDNKEYFSIPTEILRTEVSKQIILASNYLPVLKEILNSRGEENPIINLELLTTIITSTINTFKLLGIQVIVPEELKFLHKPQIALKANYEGDIEKVSYLTLYKMLDFSYEISIGDTTINKEEFLELSKKADGIVKFKNKFILIDKNEMKAITTQLKKPLPKLSSTLELIYYMVTEKIGDLQFKPEEALNKILEEITKVEEVELPKSLHAELRHYQERGFKWMYSNLKKGFGCCIADDMGLGKTIQVLSVILKWKEEGTLDSPALVVCPTTLIGNWVKECEKFAPDLNISMYYGNERLLEPQGKDIIITSYGILRRDLTKFNEQTWKLLVIDEAQNIKNPNSDQSKAVKSVKTNYAIAMSGTPVENRLTELWSIFDFINKGYLSSINSFQKEFSTPIEKYRDKTKIDLLKKSVSPFVLRRLKSDKHIISDLPDKLIFDEYTYLTTEQAALYEQVLNNTMQSIENSDGINRKGQIFKLITNLKQICNHPVHYTKTGQASKDSSGKMQQTISLLEKIIEKDEKALIFTQYKEMGNILVNVIKNTLKEEPLFFHGGLSRVKRDETVSKFQLEKDPRIMVLSLKAGGTGLNLTAATNVIHYDLWWNPAVENQATDRTYRIGQDRNVFVYRILTIGTFEEKIDEMLKAKQELADLTVSTGENWITECSNEDLKDIFRLNV